MARPLGLLALLLGGVACDRVFEVTRVDPAPDARAIACVPVGHDEDSDGLDDACDPCPYDSNNDGDDDGDGIANACDPDPVTQNHVLLFTGFGPDAATMFETHAGVIAGDEYEQHDEGFLRWWPEHDLDNVWVITGVNLSLIKSDNFAELGLVFDAVLSSTTGSAALNGTYCSLGENNTATYAHVIARDRPAMTDMILNNVPSPPFTIYDLDQHSAIVRGLYRRGGAPQIACSFVGSGQSDVGATRSPLPATGGIGIYARAVNADFRFLFVVSD